MTAEIAILNKTGIALAADSAVTIGDGSKTYNTANKVFMLSKFHPVGVMIFGGAELSGCPWETIIKIFRKDLGEKSFNTIREYADSFISFIENSKIISIEQQNKYFGRYVVDFFRSIRDQIIGLIDSEIENHGKIDEKSIKEIVSRVIDYFYNDWRDVPDLESIETGYCEKLMVEKSETIEQIYSGIFQNIPMSANSRKRLKYIAVSIVCKDRHSPWHSGVVFAGYGNNEIYPNLCSLTVDGIFDDRLKYSIDKTSSIDDENDATIIPFAQDEMVKTFMEGMDPNYKSTALGFISTVLEKLPKKFLENVKLHDEEDGAEIEKSMNELSLRIFESFRDEMREYAQDKHIQPVMQAVSSLPKDELAKVAESLVNITSFKRKVTLDVESVGGPIDVAVISKGDGFVWVKRKHYFSPELNHTFFANYYK
ncbi:hypothetical protein A7E78_09805 [Syntrophotalea acetylenivorans]|uniref:Uncharacterized protein n=1 Tax=Syntrophotalea acetylenivorans TaxID=1842532 RepID=A0A1L3GQH4_9BACT|nr:hypothetical protein [Syntrophotalea acetylenivorans]APG28110.1 hypothetical protein A7E78_09805 [Syntrophotalea acetylenivorans]